MATTENVFHRFLQLPLEMREDIWSYCLPYRVCEMDCLIMCEPEWSDDWECGTPCRLDHTSQVNQSPPLITRVCRESRLVAFRAGGLFRRGDRLSDAAQRYRFVYNFMWQDPARDMAHSNWTPEANTMCGGPLREKAPLSYLVRQASHLSGPASLMAGILRSASLPSHSRLFGGTERHPILTVEEKLDLELLKKLPVGFVVMRVIVVHCTSKAAAQRGHFGLLGDARVQVVDIAEQTKVNTLFDWAESCERHATVAQDFRRDGEWTVPLMEQRLKARIERTYHDKQLTSALRPAIMFRLCTQNCNNPITDERYRRLMAERIEDSTRGHGREQGRGRASRSGSFNLLEDSG